MTTTTAARQAIVDCHLHLYDSSAIRYAVFEARQPGFEAFVGDYSRLPRRYLLSDYLADTASHAVEGIVWHEFISEDPVKEMRWGQRLAEASAIPMALVGLVDFLDPGLDERLELYRSLPAVTAVRQHLGWDAANPLKRFAARPDLLMDERWRAGLRRLAGRDLRCGLEVFAPQLPDVLDVVRQAPDVGFTIAVMGWPTDLSAAGREHWANAIAGLARCDNAVISISASECILGLDWQAEALRPWLLTLVEAFGPHRTLLGSHLPISRLSHGFETLYARYEALLTAFSEDEKDRMFRATARDWFRLDRTPA